ncbi:unnamed protein product [Owenia fusiformis]|uniref:DNA oxidative demethylase ALKBH2 n=1 Tax=Owenia fusiformis TaxID=6347 RepID=A0A8S4PE18_OWEFU|nr:unnamed protein product [Owenia fusiformis]
MDKFVIKSKRSAIESKETPSTKNRKTDCETEQNKRIIWKKINGENLSLEHCQLFSNSEASDLLLKCEEQLEYNTGHLAKVQIFGKWIDIPRKQVAHGDDGLSYKFSGNCIPALPWTPLLTEIRDKITEITGHKFNFVLINRYKDGCDHMGEHRDDEKELKDGAPIASLTLGQQRDFIFKHADSRGKNAKRKIPPVVVELTHGMLLMMKYPTNKYWYHSLPVRKKALGLRINMTFRTMVTKQPDK